MSILNQTLTRDRRLRWLNPRLGLLFLLGCCLGSSLLGRVSAQEIPRIPHTSALAIWSFDQEHTEGSVRDALFQVPMELEGTAAIGAGGSGRSGQSTDRALEFGSGVGGAARVTDPDFFAKLSQSNRDHDQLTVVFWQHWDASVRNSSTVWFLSPTATDSERGFQAHLPWGDGNVYFDTSGCCATAAQRLVIRPESELPDLNWMSWVHVGLIKNREEKQIWINGRLIASTEAGALPLHDDWNELLLGYQNGSPANSIRGRIDDLGIFATALLPEQIRALAEGMSPLDLVMDPAEMPPRFLGIYPPPGTSYLPPDTTLRFTVVTDPVNAIDVSRVTIRLNDEELSHLLQIDGTSDSLSVQLDILLDKDTFYTVEISAADGEGRSASYSWSFDTGDTSGIGAQEPLNLNRLGASARFHPADGSTAPQAAWDGDPRTVSRSADVEAVSWQIEWDRFVRLRRLYLTASADPEHAGELDGVLVSVFNLQDQLVWQTQIDSLAPGATWLGLLPDGVEGRIVRLSRSVGQMNGAGNHRITVAEIRLHGDPTAPLGPLDLRSISAAHQSGTQNLRGPELAVDGAISTFSETLDEPGSFWMLTLDRGRRIDRLELINRTGNISVTGQMGGLTVRLQDAEGTALAETRVENPGSGGTWSWDVPEDVDEIHSLWIGLDADAVNDRGTHVVSLAEVQLFAGQNLALNKEAYMVRLTDNLPPAENANDGDLSTYTESTDRTVDAWWETDLGREFALESVRLVALDGSVNQVRLAQATLLLYDGDHSAVHEQDLNVHAVTGFMNIDVALPGPVIARYVRVGFTRKRRSSPTGQLEWFLRLREVQAFGRSLDSFGVLDFQASPGAVADGSPTTLQWEHYGLRDLQIYPDIGSVGHLTEPTGRGSMEVSPTQSTGYVLIGHHHTGNSVGFATVTVDGERLPPRISEFIASNDFSLRDGFRNSPDWIELHNPNPEPLSLEGFGLSDNPSNRMKWTFPSGIVLPPHGFLLVFASGRDIAADPAGHPHTNFSLSAAGESVILTAPDGVTILDALVDYPPQRTDLAYGRTLDGEWAFLEPTPGEVNHTPALEGWLVPPTFSHQRGFHDQPFTLSLTHPNPEADLLYSLDGSEPSELYEGPIPVSESVVVRANVRRTGYRSPRTETHSYIFLDSVMQSPRMRTLYTQGPLAERLKSGLRQIPTICIAVPELPDDYVEREASIEIFMPDGTELIQTHAGLRRKGGAWTDFSKKSYRVKFRGVYGMRKLKVPLFQGFERGFDVIDDIDILDLNAGNHDMNQRGFYMAGRFVEDSMLEMGSLNPHGRFVHVYINGEYWGQYDAHERLDDAFLATYLGGLTEDYVRVLGNDNIGDNFIPGTPDPPHREGWEFVRAHRNSYETIRSWVDIPHLIDFMLLWYYGDAESEYRAAGPREEGSGFKFWIADADGFLRASSRFHNRVGNPGPGGIFGALFAEQHPDFMTLLADRIHRHFFHQGALTPERSRQRLDLRMEEIRDSLIAECARWGYRTPQNWEDEASSVRNQFFPVRTDFLVERLRQARMYPDFDAPQWTPSQGRIVAGGTVALDGDGDSVYYTLDGTDPRLPGGAVSPTAIAGTDRITLDTIGSAQIFSRVLRNGQWSALSIAEYEVVPAPDPSRLPHIVSLEILTDGTDSEWNLQYRWYPDDFVGGSVHLQFSQNLVDWLDAELDEAAWQIHEEGNEADGSETVTLRGPLSDWADARFLRLQFLW